MRQDSSWSILASGPFSSSARPLNLLSLSHPHICPTARTSSLSRLIHAYVQRRRLFTSMHNGACVFAVSSHGVMAPVSPHCATTPVSSHLCASVPSLHAYARCCPSLHVYARRRPSLHVHARRRRLIPSMHVSARLMVNARQCPPHCQCASAPVHLIYVFAPQRPSLHVYARRCTSHHVLRVSVCLIVNACQCPSHLRQCATAPVSSRLRTTAHILSCAPAPFSPSMRVSAHPIYVNARWCPSLLCLIHVCARRHPSFHTSSTPKSAVPVFASHLRAMVPISSSSHPCLCASAPISSTSRRDGARLSTSHSRQV
jgi:hypothetical protein